MNSTITRLFLAVCLFLTLSLRAKDATAKLHSFTKQQLTDQFWAEGANFADLNRDGHNDIISGPFWYEGPDFKVRHEYAPAKETFTVKNADGTDTTIPGFEGGLGTKNTYSQNFFAFTYDINHDHWPDIIILGFPGDESWWFENPGTRLFGNSSARLKWDPLESTCRHASLSIL